MPLNTQNERLWNNYDVLMHLFCYLEYKDVVRLVITCRIIYRQIVDWPGYWKRQYRLKFCLSDRREQEWLAWYSWYIHTIVKAKNTTTDVNKQKRKRKRSSSSITAPVNNNDDKHVSPFNDLSFIPDFTASQWFYVYYRRLQNDRNVMEGQFTTRMCQLPFDSHIQLELANVNYWNALACNKDAMTLWLIKHDVLQKDNEDNSITMTCNELSIPLPPSLFDGKIQIHFVYGTHRFAMADVTISTYDDVKYINVGDKIVNIDDFEAQHINETGSKVFAASNEQSTSSSVNVLLKRRECSWRTATIVWPIADSSPPRIINLRCKHKNNQKEPKLPDIYNDWMLVHANYTKSSCQTFNLFDLDGNKWIKGPVLPSYNSGACIQFASRSQCQFLMWTPVNDSVKSDIDLTPTTIEESGAVDNKNQSTYIQWELHGTQEGQTQCKKTLSGQFTVLKFPGCNIKAQMYTTNLCLVVVYHTFNFFSQNLLLMFALGSFGENDSTQTLFDTIDYSQSMPISSSAQGRILWSRPINDDVITGLYSKKLVTVQIFNAIEVLNAQDGTLLRSITCPSHVNFTPFLGSLCAMVDKQNGPSWFVDMHTGCTYKGPACLIRRKKEDAKENRLSRSINAVPAPCSFSGIQVGSLECHTSSSIIGRINVDSEVSYEVHSL